MSIQVKEFIHVPGENDTEYIRLLNEQIKRQKKLLNKAMAKLRETEPRIGQWIEVDCFESEKHSVTDMRCSLCGKYASIVLPHRTRCVYDYCPNCGARMKGSDDEKL